MKHLKILIFLLIIPSVWLASCYKDGGNYDYDWIPKTEVSIPVADTTVIRGSYLVLEPKIVENTLDQTGHNIVETKEIVNYDDYDYIWYVIRAGNTKKDSEAISTKRTLDEQIFLPLETANAHRLYLVVKNKKTGVEATTYLSLRVVYAYTKAFLFLTEDEERNVDLELFATTNSGTEVLEKNVLENAGFPFTTGGANSVLYMNQRGVEKQIWIATGSGVAWLNSDDLTYKPIYNIGTVMAKPVHTFSRMLRGGSNERVTYQYASYCMLTPEGTVHSVTVRGKVIPNAAYVDKLEVKVAQVAAVDANCTMLWDETNSRFIVFKTGTMYGPDSFCTALAGEANAPYGSSPVHMGRSRATGKKLIAVVKHPDGEYWKYEWNTNTSGIAEFSRKVALNGTPELGKIDNMVNDLKSGDLYCTVNDRLYTYREQPQDPKASAWKEVEFYDTAGKRIEIAFDHITMLHAEDYALKSKLDDPLYNAIYLITYSPSAEGKAYVLQVYPDGENTKLTLYKTISGLGNVKSMSYWGHV